MNGWSCKGEAKPGRPMGIRDFDFHMYSRSSPAVTVISSSSAACVSPPLGLHSPVRAPPQDRCSSSNNHAVRFPSTYCPGRSTQTIQSSAWSCRHIKMHRQAAHVACATHTHSTTAHLWLWRCATLLKKSSSGSSLSSSCSAGKRRGSAAARRRMSAKCSWRTAREGLLSWLLAWRGAGGEGAGGQGRWLTHG